MRNCFAAIVSLSLLTVVLPACGRRSVSAEPLAIFPVDARLLRGNESGLRDPMNRVITTADDFGQIWQQAVSTQRTPAPPPQVDFTRNMLVVIAAGRMLDEDVVRVDSILEREVTGAARTERELQVYYTLLEGCRRSDSQAAYPVEIVQVRRYTGAIKFMPPQRTPNCR